MKVIERADDFFSPFSIAAIGGFDLAWTLMKNPRFDMAFNVGLAIPIGLLTGLIVGGAKAWSGFKMPRSITVAALVAVGMFSLMPLAQILMDLKAASIVAPILIRDGFMTTAVPTRFFLWSAGVFLAFALAWFTFYFVRRQGTTAAR